jgi:hypothetical protein
MYPFFQSKALTKFTQIWIFGLKTNHLATLATMTMLTEKLPAAIKFYPQPN